jgi:GT2 family glycosyltransferase
MTSASVIVPTRNRSRLLAVTLRSVLWQRDVDLEVIVVDDASTDDTPDVVASFADPRVRLLSQPTSQGPSAARNLGLGEATGTWVGFVDDDDVWAPTKIAGQIGAADMMDRHWAYTGTVNVGGALQVISGGPPPTAEEVLAALPGRNPIPGGGSNVLVRRSLLEGVGGFDERLPPCEDWDMWIRLARRGAPAAVIEPLLGYRLHGESTSLDTEKVLRSARLLEAKHDVGLDWGAIHRWLAESCLRLDRHRESVTHLARAAVNGEARGVVADLSAILRRRVGMSARHEDPRLEDWRRQAQPWLHALHGEEAS